MKKYTCLNSGECNWADEIPPREFSLDAMDLNCPNCGKANIREVEEHKPAIKRFLPFIAGAILLSGLIWLFWPKPEVGIPLHVSAKDNCAKNSVTVSIVGGNGEPIMIYAPELGTRQVDSIFRIPNNKRSGATLTFWAVQSGDSVKASLMTNCEKPVVPSDGDNGKDPGNPPAPEHGGKGNSNSVVWSRIKGSEFCVEDCVVEYTEVDNLGHTRTHRTNNYAGCCPANN